MEKPPRQLRGGLTYVCDLFGARGEVGGDLEKTGRVLLRPLFMCLELSEQIRKSFLARLAQIENPRDFSRRQICCREQRIEVKLDRCSLSHHNRLLPITRF